MAGSPASLRIAVYAWKRSAAPGGAKCDASTLERADHSAARSFAGAAGARVAEVRALGATAAAGLTMAEVRTLGATAGLPTGRGAMVAAGLPTGRGGAVLPLRATSGRRTCSIETGNRWMIQM